MQEIEKIVAELKADYAKYSEKGNKAAGTRYRKGLVSLIKVAKEERKKSIEASKAE